MNAMDTLLYDLSIPAISSLQTLLSEQAGFMQLMSVVFDPKYAFLIYSPIAYLFDQKVGKKLILTTVLAEWLNQILKWFLHGERPYWYVHSSGHFDAQQVPIKQFPITCELGPGNPSGHAMVTAAVWYIIIDSLLQLRSSSIYNGQQQTALAASLVECKDKTATENAEPKSSDYLTNGMARASPTSSEMIEHCTSAATALKEKVSMWAIYILLLATVSVSRVFLGCHFPHQCLAGALLGLSVAKTVSKLDSKAVHFIGASAFLFSTAFGTFCLLQVLGFDPAWTIKMATTHCVKREYIHLDTAPFFSIMRYCGFALGAGIALLFPLKHYTKQLITPNIDNDECSGDKETTRTRNISWLSIKLLMALVMARLVDNLGLFVSHTNLPVLYASAFLAYTLFSFAFINL